VCRRGLSLLWAGLLSLASWAVSCWLVVASVKRSLLPFRWRVRKGMLLLWRRCRRLNMSMWRWMPRVVVGPRLSIWRGAKGSVLLSVPALAFVASPPPTTAPPPTAPPTTTTLEAIAASTASTSSGVQILVMLGIAGLLLLVWTLYRSIGS